MPVCKVQLSLQARCHAHLLLLGYWCTYEDTTLLNALFKINLLIEQNQQEPARQVNFFFLYRQDVSH